MAAFPWTIVSFLQGSNGLNQTFLVAFVVVEASIVHEGGEKVDEEIANDCSYDVHHERKGDERT